MGNILIVVFFAAWLTHVITCLSTAAWGFVLAGCIVFPVAIIHGFMIWASAL